MSAPVILWFRRDLRLADNAALAAALARGGPILPLFILDEHGAGSSGLGGASRWWLRESLIMLRNDLAARGVNLILDKGPAAAVLDDVIAQTGADAIYWNRIYDPAERERDTAIKADLKSRGLDVQSFNALALAEPWTIQTRQGGPYKVFTPYWRALADQITVNKPVAAPDRFPAGPDVRRLSIDDLNLAPKPDWAAGLRASWTPGEAGAHARLRAFLNGGVYEYGAQRDRPDKDGTSRLSPHLHWGELCPHAAFRAVAEQRASGDLSDAHAEAFLQELGWREFSLHLLHHFPELPDAAWRADFDAFPWRDDPDLVEAWRSGRTGYPIVDAGMRQLWAIGWMHNRVRMVVASFLTKHLLQHWRVGAAWFWDTLVDADLASNSASWQWVAGCGADAAPYFRIFNPTAQGEKFDPDGDYVRQWVPELAHMPAKHIHAPWAAPASVLRESGVQLGENYPHPIIDHKDARQRALSAYQQMKAAA